MALDYIGQIAMERGRMDESLSVLQDSRRSWQNQARARPDDRGLRLALAVNAAMLGESYAAAGRHDDAVRIGEEGLAELAAWSQHHPDDTGTYLAKDKCELWRMVANSLERLGKWKEALTYRDQAAALAKAAVEAQPKDPVLWRTAAICFTDLATHYLSVSDAPAALEQAEAATECANGLLEFDRESALNWRALLPPLAVKADCLVALEKWDAAGETSRLRLSFCERLLTRDPGSAVLQIYVARAHDDLAQCLEHQNQLSDALPQYEEASEVFQRVALAYPSRADWRKDWAICLFRKGNLALRVEAFGAARDSYLLAARIREALLRDNPSDLGMRVQLATCYASASGSAEKGGDAKRALDLMEQANGILSVPEAHPIDDPRGLKLARSIMEDLERLKKAGNSRP